MADPLLEEEYQKYVFEMQEQGLQPMSFEEFVAQARAGMNEGGIVMQGGVKNYLGKQKTVSNVPVKWQSGPDKPNTELAYITKAEKDLLLKEDIHGSLQDGPNTGPGGIMSLDSQGDFTRDRSPKGRQDAGGNERSRQAQAQHEQHMREILTGQKNIGQTTAYRGPTGDDLVPTGTGDYVSKTESTKPDSSLLDYMPGIGMLRRIASVFGPIDNKEFFIQKVVGGKNKYGYTEDDYEEYMKDRQAGIIDAYGNLTSGLRRETIPHRLADGTMTTREVIMGEKGGEGQARELNRLYSGQGGGGGGTTVPPVVPPVETENPFVPGSGLPFANYYVGANPNAAQLAYGQQMGVDPRIYGLTAYADGGRIGYAGGGIADLRQGYFLGKLVKKIGRGIKKVAKSPLGKLAMLAAPLAFGPGKSFFMDKALPFLKTGKGAMTGIAALSALPLIFGSSEEEEEGGVNYADLSNIFDTVGSPSELRARALRGE